jgi:hypothetical protein
MTMKVTAATTKTMAKTAANNNNPKYIYNHTQQKLDSTAVKPHDQLHKGPAR